MLGLNTCATIAQLLGRILNINRILESGFRNFKTEGYSNIGRKSLGGFVLFFSFGFIERFWEKHRVPVSLPTLLSVSPSFAPCTSGTHSLQGWASSNTSLLTKVHHFHENSILCYTLYGFWQMFSVMHVALYWTGSWQSWCPLFNPPPLWSRQSLVCLFCTQFYLSLRYLEMVLQGALGGLAFSDGQLAQRPPLALSLCQMGASGTHLKDKKLGIQSLLGS